MIGILCLLFALDWLDYSYIDLGRVSGKLLAKGEWWRLFSAPFLHFGIGHIVGNVLALWLIGRRTEAEIGSLRFLTIYVISALIGALGSAAINPPNVGSVGASGAIQGVLSALYVAGLVRGRQTDKGRSICTDALGLGVLTVIYSVISDFAGRAFGVDLNAHIFGGIAGGLAAVALLVRPDSESRGEKRYGFNWAWRVASIGAIAVMAIILSVIVVRGIRLPYGMIRLGEIASLILIALFVSVYLSLSSPASSDKGRPFSLRRVISTQGKTAVFIICFGIVWALCMYSR